MLILASTGTNVTVASGASDNLYGHAKCGPHAATLIGEDGKLSFGLETLAQVARSVPLDVLSLPRDRSDSGLIARIAGDAISTDCFLPNTATKIFSHACRMALEASAETAGVPGRIKVKDTRAAMVEHDAEGKLVHPAAGMAPSVVDAQTWVERYCLIPSDADENDHSAALDDQTSDGDCEAGDSVAGQKRDEDFREAAG